MKQIFVVLIFLIIAGQQTAEAQQYEFRYKGDVKVVTGTDTLENAWAGGFNSPQFSKIHLNNDTQEDLFVFDRTTSKISTFLAVNTNGTWGWQYAPEYEHIFPDDLYSWVLLRDYDNDGRKDIFCYSTNGVKVYRNVPPATPGGVPTFQVFKNPLINATSGSGLYVSYYEVPLIDDMDGDGDLDLVFFDNNKLEFYRNTGGASLTYSQVPNAFGNVYRCDLVCNSYTFGVNNCRLKQKMHLGGVTVLGIDINNDGKKDLVFGQEDCPGLVQMLNTGTVVNPVFASVQTGYPAGANPANAYGFLAGFYEDVTFDGIKDLLVAPAAASNVHANINMTKSAWFYHNTGTNANPVFSFQQRDFLQNNMVEVGESAAPAFADLDGDGDLDMLVGSQADLESFTGFRGSIYYYKNVGSATNPVFKLETNDFLNLSSLNFTHIRPFFADINGDNAPDLLFYATDGGAGNLRYILNTASAGQPASYPIANMALFPYGYFSGDSPAFYDLDGDGDKDLLIASVALGPGFIPSWLSVYENTGTAAQPVWTYRFNRAGNIGPNTFGPYSIHIADLNGDNNPELLVADNTGEIRLYENFLYRLNQNFTAQTQIFYNPLTATRTASLLGSGIIPVTADLNGDGRPELIVGLQGGGLQYFDLVSVGPAIPVSQPQPLGVKEPLAATSISIYPNPTRQQVNIKADEKVSIEIFDIVGKKVLANAVFEKEHQLEIKLLKPGVYVVQLQTTDGRKAAKKLVVQ